VPGALLPYLTRHGWPGNVRELENVIERAMLSARELLGAWRGRTVPGAGAARAVRRRCANPPCQALPGVGPAQRRQAAQLRHVQETLDSCQGNLDEAARQLGISGPRCGDGSGRRVEPKTKPALT
jgi:propionate catabolism operon transcriptional regulator